MHYGFVTGIWIVLLELDRSFYLEGVNDKTISELETIVDTRSVGTGDSNGNLLTASGGGTLGDIISNEIGCYYLSRTRTLLDH
jgi:hypothetical protein